MSGRYDFSGDSNINHNLRILSSVKAVNLGRIYVFLIYHERRGARRGNEVTFGFFYVFVFTLFNFA